MTQESIDPRTHWQRVYRTRSPQAVSWYRPHLQASLDLLELAGLAVDSSLIDVGGGASTLVDDLLDRGVSEISVLDVSPEALSIARRRLGPHAKDVNWLAVDVLQAKLLEGQFDLWHDRAVLHFLTNPSDALQYARQAARAVRIDGHAVIGGFAPDGPERCSGLRVARRSAEEIAALLAPAFQLVAKQTERHRTPAGAEQSFEYALLLRK